LATIPCAPPSDRILGATIVAPHAGDLLAPIVLAMKQRIGLGQIASVIHSYPTQAEAIRRLGDQYNKTRLTPRVKWLLNTWLRWTG
jgi:pyruvate/2-oxoglutarate dehydrogenase complex dihydrolipoamide dehydrogenase (E3) component